MTFRSFRLNHAVLAMLAAGVPPLSSAAEQVRFHDDYRQTAKLIFSPAQTHNKAGLQGEAQARDFLQRNANRFGLTDISGLKLARVQQSLAATHYHYQQYINDVPVLRGEAIVSISKRDGAVLRAFNNTYPTSAIASKAAQVKLSADDALNKAWSYLQATGKLHFEPTSKLYYVPVDKQLVLAYRTELSATAPLGGWEHIVDASTGEMLVARRTDLPRKTAANPNAFGNLWPAAAANAAHRPLAEARQQWQEKQQARAKAASTAMMRVDGSGKVFDPDPRTTKNNTTYGDSTVIPADAYYTRVLQGITFTGATHVLTGPHVDIVEIEAPATAPSTSATGVWDHIRTANAGGSNAFNDAMTYFHLDQSQRYMQSLGFTGAKGIIERPLDVDTDGLGGDDNSHYVYGGSSDYLAFGHGCVDDNEDADVILHEYGHAIQNNINPNWDGGDTGAMGEGFGDYWAGAYSYTTPNGNVFDPAKVYTWDGISECWSGRRMDRTSFQYNSAFNYGAHETVAGVLGDELWSTPLFQALLEFDNQGISLDDANQIILESHFGLGANLDMPDMAQAIVDTAQTLFPAGEHSAIFLSKFQEVNILSGGNRAPDARVAQSTITATYSSNVTLNASSSTDPDGDTLSFSWTQTSGTAVTLTNANSAQATFTAPGTAGTLVFQVTVSDGNGGSDTASVTVNVTSGSSGGGDDGYGGGGGSISLFGAMALLLAGWRRSVRR